MRGGSTRFGSHGKAEQHDDEGTWIFSYADMITILMMFFILLLSISSIDVKKFETLKGAIAQSKEGQGRSLNDGRSGLGSGSGLGNGAETGNGSAGRNLTPSFEPGIASVPFRDLAASAAEYSAADANAQLLAAVGTLLAAVDTDQIQKESLQEKAFRDAQQKIAELAQKQEKSFAKEDKAGQVINVSFASSRIFLENGTLSPEGARMLAQLARYLVQLTPVPEIVVSSFVSKSESASSLPALRLSNRRALAVLDFLIRNKVPAHALAMAGYGDSKVRLSEMDAYGNPLAAAAQANSRVEISIRRRKELQP
jgi:chemotaxis protein MotB